MKKIYFAFILSMVSLMSFAQVPTRSINPESLKEYASFMSIRNKEFRTLTMEKVDTLALQKEDKIEKDLGKPFRFGKDLNVNIDLHKDGTWEDVAGGRVWRVQIKSPNAWTINMIFDRFFLPPGAKVFISNGTKNMVAGPIDESQNSPSGMHSTSLFKGNSVIIELFEPAEYNGKTELRVSKVIHGYKQTPFAGFGQSASCEINANCTEGNGWNDEKNMVAMVLLQNNTRWCSGTLLNNTCQNFTPNFLTAFHCLDTDSNGQPGAGETNSAQTWNFMFHYISPNCSPNSDDPNFYYFSGSTYRAGWNVSDFALVELAQMPTATSGIRYAGWSRTTTAATSSVGLHHPAGDVMKISVENNAAVSVNWNGGAANTHWLVNFDAGTVEGGSSGSPLFNQNHRVVGQLHGGSYYSDLPNGGRCQNKDARYGRFDVSWDGGGTADTRLRDWLDPNGSSATDMASITLPFVSGPSVLCTSGNYVLNNVPAGAAVSWSVTPTGPVSPSSGTGSTASLTMNNPEDVTIRFRVGCNATRDIEQKLYIGPPQFGGFLVNGNPTSNATICTNSYTSIAAVPNDVSSSYYWSQSDPNGFIANASSSSTAFNAYNSSCYYLNVNIYNICGSRNETLTLCAQNCFARYTVFPNPAKDFITVEFDQIESAQALPDEIVLLSEKSTNAIKSINVQEVYRRNGFKNGKQIEIEAKGLPRGTYYLHIKNNRLKDNKLEAIRILLE